MSLTHSHTHTLSPQKPFGGVSMFGGDEGASFLTESLRSSTSSSSSSPAKPAADNKTASSPALTATKKSYSGSGGGLFGEGGEGGGDLFESPTTTTAPTRCVGVVLN